MPSNHVVKGKVPVTVTDAVIREIKQKSGNTGAGGAGGGDNNSITHRIGRPLGSLNKKPAVGRRSSARSTRRPASFIDNSDCILDEYEEIGLKAEDVGKLHFLFYTSLFPPLYCPFLDCIENIVILLIFYYSLFTLLQKAGKYPFNVLHSV